MTPRFYAMVFTIAVVAFYAAGCDEGPNICSLLNTNPGNAAACQSQTDPAAHPVCGQFVPTAGTTIVICNLPLAAATIVPPMPDACGVMFCEWKGQTARIDAIADASTVLYQKGFAEPGPEDIQIQCHDTGISTYYVAQGANPWGNLTPNADQCVDTKPAPCAMFGEKCEALTGGQLCCDMTPDGEPLTCGETTLAPPGGSTCCKDHRAKCVSNTECCDLSSPGHPGDVCGASNNADPDHVATCCAPAGGQRCELVPCKADSASCSCCSGVCEQIDSDTVNGICAPLPSASSQWDCFTAVHGSTTGGIVMASFTITVVAKDAPSAVAVVAGLFPTTSDGVLYRFISAICVPHA